MLLTLRKPPPPALSRRSRLMWSVPAGLIIALWFLGILGGGATQFLVKYSTFEVVAAIARNPGRAIWPGEFGHTRLWVMKLAQVTPWLALILWPACLVPWPRRRLRLASLLVALLVPAGSLIAAPIIILIAPVFGLAAVAFGASGETYQDGVVAAAAAALWWWLLVPAAVLTARTPVHCSGRCRRCGYDLTGNTTGVCPECGATTARTTA